MNYGSTILFCTSSKTYFYLKPLQACLTRYSRYISKIHMSPNSTSKTLSYFEKLWKSCHDVCRMNISLFYILTFFVCLDGFSRTIKSLSARKQFSTKLCILLYDAVDLQEWERVIESTSKWKAAECQKSSQISCWIDIQQKSYKKTLRWENSTDTKAL